MAETTDPAIAALVEYGKAHGWSIPYIEKVAPELVKIVRANS